jgi:hypothetical protein
MERLKHHCLIGSGQEFHQGVELICRKGLIVHDRDTIADFGKGNLDTSQRNATILGTLDIDDIDALLLGILFRLRLLFFIFVIRSVKISMLQQEKLKVTRFIELTVPRRAV